MKSLLFTTIFLLISTVVSDCFALNGTIALSDIKYLTNDTNEGIYPCETVLHNGNNPFKGIFLSYANGGRYKWDIEYLQGNYAVKYYCWATCLAQDPSGEAQYYTAENLVSIANSQTDPIKKEEIKRRAVRAYYSVLTNFPLTKIYVGAQDNAGYSILPKCVTAIESLGGNPFPFANVETSDGTLITIKQPAL